MPGSTTAQSPIGLSRTSERLKRAAAAERRGLERRRRGLLNRRAGVLAKLEPIDRALAEIDERVALLQELAGPLPVADAADERVGPRSAEPALLRGSAIREAAVRTLRAQPQLIEALHYRDWYELVRRAGHTVAGADPLAVFLTQLTRSPLITRSTQPGVYALDPTALHRLRGELERLGQGLRQSTRAEVQATDLATLRAHRRELQRSIDRRERALEEALRTLAADQLDEQCALGPARPTSATSTTGPPEAGTSIHITREEQPHARP